MEKKYKINKNFILKNDKWFIYSPRYEPQELKYVSFKNISGEKFPTGFEKTYSLHYAKYVNLYIQTNSPQITIVAADISFLCIYFPLKDHEKDGNLNVDELLDFIIKHHYSITDELDKSENLKQPTKNENNILNKSSLKNFIGRLWKKLTK